MKSDVALKREKSTKKRIRRSPHQTSLRQWFSPKTTRFSIGSTDSSSSSSFAPFRISAPSSEARTQHQKTSSGRGGISASIGSSSRSTSSGIGTTAKKRRRAPITTSLTRSTAAKSRANVKGGGERTSSSSWKQRLTHRNSTAGAAAAAAAAAAAIPSIDTARSIETKMKVKEAALKKTTVAALVTPSRRRRDDERSCQEKDTDDDDDDDVDDYVLATTSVDVAPTTEPHITTTNTTVKPTSVRKRRRRKGSGLEGREVLSSLTRLTSNNHSKRVGMVVDVKKQRGRYAAPPLTGIITDSQAFQMPVATTARRPSSASSASMIISDSQAFEVPTTRRKPSATTAKRAAFLAKQRSFRSPCPSSAMKITTNNHEMTTSAGRGSNRSSSSSMDLRQTTMTQCLDPLLLEDLSADDDINDCNEDGLEAATVEESQVW
eukprot:jgi/Bigna1/76270/fgenesh1_pg.40_\